MMLLGDDYRQVHEALLQDPVIQRMARDIRESGRPKSEFAHDDGTPEWNFMQRASNGYAQLCEQEGTEQIGSHIGGPANAILQLAYPPD